MSKLSHNQLRAERKRWRLTQNELAFLAGLKSRGAVSDAERFLRTPTLAFVLACEVVFGKTARKLFSGLFEEVEREVLRRADELHREITSQSGSVADTKRKFLLALSTRPRPRNSNV